MPAPHRGFARPMRRLIVLALVIACHGGASRPAPPAGAASAAGDTGDAPAPGDVGADPGDPPASGGDSIPAGDPAAPGDPAAGGDSDPGPARCFVPVVGPGLPELPRVHLDLSVPAVTGRTLVVAA